MIKIKSLNHFTAFFSLLFFLSSCKEQADLLITNAHIYTVDSAFTTANAMAVKNGKIIAVGTFGSITARFHATKKIDGKGKYIYPGFIDAHTHFFLYGQSLADLDVSDTKSWDAVLEKVKLFSDKISYPWILGRGWDQNNWNIKEFPNNDRLNILFPDRPVFLRRIDGHAAIANQKALDIAGIKPGDKISGGSILTKNGKLTGILIDNAVDLVLSKIPKDSEVKKMNGLRKIQSLCFEQGLTSVHDCGLDYPDVTLLQKAERNGILKMRIYILLSDRQDNILWLEKSGTIKSDRLHVGGLKIFADGALGSRGACLLKPYEDQNNWHGFLLSSLSHFDSVIHLADTRHWQIATHAIGDSSNRVILQLYAKYLKGKNDKRWRIEHAQVIDSSDIHLFKDYNIIPSVQPTHAISDMHWVAKKLGFKRLKYAYAYKTLLQQNGWIPLGTDFPVESISPLKTFIAAVFRTDSNDLPKGGFQIKNAISRRDALRGITIWPAKAAFEDREKGSLEPGKFADFVILDTDLMKANAQQLRKAKVIQTYLNGAPVYNHQN